MWFVDLEKSCKVINWSILENKSRMAGNIMRVLSIVNNGEGGISKFRKVMSINKMLKLWHLTWTFFFITNTHLSSETKKTIILNYRVFEHCCGKWGPLRIIKVECSFRPLLYYINGTFFTCLSLSSKILLYFLKSGLNLYVLCSMEEWNSC